MMSTDEFLRCWHTACLHPNAVFSTERSGGLYLGELFYVKVGYVDLCVSSSPYTLPISERSACLMVSGEHISGVGVNTPSSTIRGTELVDAHAVWVVNRPDVRSFGGIMKVLANVPQG